MAIVDVSCAQIVGQVYILKPADQVRANSLVGTRRALFLATRAATYEFLSGIVGMAPSSFEIVSNGRNRPVLQVLPEGEGSSFQASNIGVSFSYTKDRALAGIGFGCRIGVDIEARPKAGERRRAVAAIRAEYLSEDAGMPFGVESSPKDDDFHREWARHEALHKLMGKGLAFPAHEPERCLSNVSIQDLDVGACHAAAVATDWPLNISQSLPITPERTLSSGCQAFLLYPEQ